MDQDTTQRWLVSKRLSAVLDREMDVLVGTKCSLKLDFDNVSLVWDYRMPIYVFFIQILRAFEEVFK
jgi:primosomal protein N'